MKFNRLIKVLDFSYILLKSNLYLIIVLLSIGCENSCKKDPPVECQYDEPIAINVAASTNAYTNNYCPSFANLNFCSPSSGNWASSHSSWDPKTTQDWGRVWTFLELCETSEWSPLDEKTWVSSNVDFDATYTMCYINLERYIKYETMSMAEVKTRCGFCGGGNNRYATYYGETMINKSTTWKSFITLDLQVSVLIYSTNPYAKCI